MMVLTQDEIRDRLLAHGIQPTTQRMVIARSIFTGCAHYSAEEVFVLANHEHPQVSKATVYNTLGLFARQGLVREVIADPDRVYYDTNLAPHHHFFDTSSGKLTDIPAESVGISCLPDMPSGMKMEGVEVIVRVRPDTSTQS